MNRGDVLLTRFPHPSGGRGKKRPVVVVQADSYAQSLRTLVVAEITHNLAMATDPACLFIDISTLEARRPALFKTPSCPVCLWPRSTQIVSIR